MKRRKKYSYINRKSFTAVLLSLVLAFASVSSIQTQAEEPGAEGLPTTEDTGAPEQGEGAAGTETEEEPAYVRTQEGAVIITAFAPLSDAQAQISLEERETLAEITARMPGTLMAYANAYVTETPDGAENPDEGEKNPDEGEKPGESEKPVEGENPGVSDESDEGGSNTEDEQAVSDDTPLTESTVRKGWWHFFVETVSGNSDESTEENVDENQPGDDDTDKGPENEDKRPEDVEKQPENGGEQPPAEEPATQSVEVEIPVTWECADYESEELEAKKFEYIFTPK